MIDVAPSWVCIRFESLYDGMPQWTAKCLLVSMIPTTWNIQILHATELYNLHRPYANVISFKYGVKPLQGQEW